MRCRQYETTYPFLLLYSTTISYLGVHRINGDRLYEGEVQVFYNNTLGYVYMSSQVEPLINGDPYICMVTNHTCVGVYAIRVITISHPFQSFRSGGSPRQRRRTAEGRGSGFFFTMTHEAIMQWNSYLLICSDLQLCLINWERLQTHSNNQAWLTNAAHY